MCTGPTSCGLFTLYIFFIYYRHKHPSFFFFVASLGRTACRCLAPLDCCVVFIEIRSSAGLSEVFQSVLKTPTAGQEMEGLMELDAAARHSDQKQYF